MTKNKPEFTNSIQDMYDILDRKKRKEMKRMQEEEERKRRKRMQEEEERRRIKNMQEEEEEERKRIKRLKKGEKERKQSMQQTKSKGSAEEMIKSISTSLENSKRYRDSESSEDSESFENLSKSLEELKRRGKMIEHVNLAPGSIINGPTMHPELLRKLYAEDSPPPTTNTSTYSPISDEPTPPYGQERNYTEEEMDDILNKTMKREPSPEFREIVPTDQQTNFPTGRYYVMGQNSIVPSQSF